MDHQRMTRPPVWPDYSNSGLNVAASVLRHFGAPCAQAGQADVDALLAQKPYKNIVLMLFDGLGAYSLEELLPPDSFLRTHLLRRMSAVFPPTTVAATTSIESGLAPCEHAWLGWSLYLPPLDRLVDAFTNRDSLSGEALPGPVRAVDQVLPYRNIVSQLNDTGRVQAHIVSKHGDTHIDTLDEMAENVLRLCNTEGRQYVYTYWNEPDHTMHDKGIGAVEKIVRDIDARVQALCDALPSDTLVMVTADHGLTDTEPVPIDQYPELVNACLRPYHVESRAASFFVKPEYLADFPNIVARNLGTADFYTVSSAEAVAAGLFGQGREHPLFRQMVGDYWVIATGRKSLYREADPHPMIGMHAGLTAREMTVPLIVAKR